jgi:AP-2 complex subunit alpha
MWYVDVILQLIKLSGDHVAEPVWYRVVQIVTNEGEGLQRYATGVVWRSLLEEGLPHRTLVKVSCAPTPLTPPPDTPSPLTPPLTSL